MKQNKTTVKGGKLSDDVSKKDILPQIYQKIAELENAELQEGGVQILVDFSWIKTDFEDMKNDQFTTEHNKIVQLENSLKIASLVIQFIRGKFYLFAREY